MQRNDITVLLVADTKGTGVDATVAFCDTRDDKGEVPWYTWIIVAVIAKLLLHVIIATAIELAVIKFSYAPHNARVQRLLRLCGHFSLRSNFHELMSPESSGEKFNAINGLKAISLAWIVYTHTYLVPIKEY